MGAETHRDERLFGEIAIKKKLLSREQLKQALDLQRDLTAGGDETRLGKLLVDHGFMREDQVDEVVREQNYMLLRWEDKAFGKRAVAEGHLTQTALDRALDDQSKLFRQEGKLKGIKELLESSGDLRVVRPGGIAHPSAAPTTDSPHRQEHVGSGKVPMGHRPTTTRRRHAGGMRKAPSKSNAAQLAIIVVCAVLTVGVGLVAILTQSKSNPKRETAATPEVDLPSDQDSELPAASRWPNGAPVQDESVTEGKSNPPYDPDDTQRTEQPTDDESAVSEDANSVTPRRPKTILPWPNGAMDRTAAITRFRAAAVHITTDIGTGSGFVIDPRGVVITNRHVIEGSTSFLVGWDAASARTAVRADLVAAYDDPDIAVLRLPPGEYESMPVCWGYAPNIGADVIALGFPLAGEGVNSIDRESVMATAGIVNRLGEVAGLGEQIIADVRVNPGNSGGALFDLTVGGVVGVVVARGASADSAGLSFAIPVTRIPLDPIPEMRADINRIASHLNEWSRPSDPEGEFEIAAALSDGYESEGKFGRALTVLDSFISRNHNRLESVDPPKVKAIRDRLDAARTRLRSRVQDEWAKFEQALAAAGESMAAIELASGLRDKLADEHMTKAMELLLPIANKLIIRQVREGNRLLPSGKPRPDRVFLASDDPIEGYLVEETVDAVVLQVGSGKMRLSRDMITRVEPGNLNEHVAAEEGAKRAFQNALAIGYTDPVRELLAEVIAGCGSSGPLQDKLGDACGLCGSMGAFFCGGCSGTGAVVSPCPTCTPKEGATVVSCRRCKSEGRLKHKGFGEVVLRPAQYKGQACRNCGGDGERFDAGCSICDGTGRIGTQGQPEELWMPSCDESGIAQSRKGSGMPCSKFYPQLRRRFDNWTRRWTSVERLSFVSSYWSVYSIEAFTKAVEAMSLLIEEYSLCDKGFVPCFACRKTCAKCKAGVLRAECAGCKGSGLFRCPQCMGLGSTLAFSRLVSVYAAESAKQMGAELIRDLKSK